MSERATRAVADWLDAVPDHWEVGNIRRFARMKTGHTPSRGEPTYWADCTIPWFTLADVWQLRDGRQRFLGDTSEKISELGLQNSAAELLPAGTVVLSRTASVGFTGIMPVPMATSQDFWNWVCEPNLLPDFLYWQLCAMGHKFRQLTNGSTHKTIYQGDAASLEVCVPPLHTQRRIARFLNEKTVRIDGLIEKKRALLYRLAEKRQALITRAVTKGLDPAAPMKPSGIDWLGEIPAHWGLVPFKWRCSVQSGQVDPLDPAYSSMPLIAPDHIESATGRLWEVATAEEQGAISGKYLCPIGSVLYSKIRPALRKVTLYDKECLCSADMYAIDPGRDLDRKYLFYFFLTDAFTSYAELESLRVAMPKVNRDALGAFPLPIPPLHEQARIALFCVKADEMHREAGDQLTTSIEKLEEYRAAVIAAAVTGKLAMDAQPERECEEV